jgi:hypothetical protein
MTTVQRITRGSIVFIEAAFTDHDGAPLVPAGSLHHKYVRTNFRYRQGLISRWRFDFFQADGGPVRETLGRRLCGENQRCQAKQMLSSVGR